MKKSVNLSGDFLFILGLIVLAINDHFLKLYYPSELTGKLSDLAGLFIFPIFLSAVLPFKIRTNCFLTALIFVLWNSPLVEPLIIAGKSFGIPFHRTVDPTDLIALFVLPFSYLYLKKRNGVEKKYDKKSGMLLLVVSFFVLTSTTLAPNFDATLNKKYKINSSKDEILKEVENFNCQLTVEISDQSDTIYIIKNLVIESDSIIRQASFSLKEHSAYSILTIKQIVTFRSYPAFCTWGQRKRIKKIAEKYIVEELK